MLWAKRPRPENQQAAPEGERRTGLLRRFRSNVRGAAALEFAMIAPAFFMILFPMFEIGITFTADAILQNALNEASRRIRTGELQTSGGSPAVLQGQFREWVCDGIVIPLTCDESVLKLDVRPSSSFGDTLKDDGAFRDDYQFVPGGPGDTIVVRALYAWSPITPFLGEAMQNMPDGKHLLQATAAFRNEPYQ